LLIHPDGSVKYEGEYYVATCGPAAGTIPAATFGQLMKDLEQLGFLELRDTYQSKEDGCAIIVTDFASYTIEVTSQTLSKRVERYGGCGAGAGVQALDRFAERVDAVVRADRWILPCNVDPEDAPGETRVYFDAGSTSLRAKAQVEALNEVVALLASHPDRGLEIVGHADAKEQKGASLSLARISGVISHLVAQGVDVRRLSTSALGSSAPLEGMPSRFNRRVDLRLNPPLRCGCVP
jgi:outer membrane protein OmpA-like peptidoglycan-associated protein